MTAHRVVVLRHGRTAHNARRTWQGQLDTPLDAVGLRQAEAAARVLRDLPPSAIVTSDLMRASATAAAVSAASGVPATPDPRLRELDVGTWSGLTRDEITAAGWGEQLAAWRRGDDLAVGGAERPSELARRGAQALSEHAAGLDGGVLVAVAHGAVLRTAVLSLLGVEQGRWQSLASLENCAWGVLSPGRSTWRLVAWGLTAPADGDAPSTDVKAASESV